MRARNSLLLALVAFSLLAVYCRAVPQHWSAHYFIGFPDGVVLYLGFLLASSPLVNSALVNRYHLGRLLSLLLFAVNSIVVYALSRYLCQGLPHRENGFLMLTMLGLLWLCELLLSFRDAQCMHTLYPELGQFVGALRDSRASLYPAVIMIFWYCRSLAIYVAYCLSRDPRDPSLIGNFDIHRVLLMYTLLVSLQCAILPWKGARWLAVLMLLLFVAALVISPAFQSAR